MKLQRWSFSCPALDRDLFVALGTRTYGENTGNLACTYYEVQAWRDLSCFGEKHF